MKKFKFCRAVRFAARLQYGSTKIAFFVDVYLLNPNKRWGYFDRLLKKKGKTASLFYLPPKAQRANFCCKIILNYVFLSKSKIKTNKPGMNKKVPG